jgi:hypothetical protein
VAASDYHDDELVGERGRPFDDEKSLLLGLELG